MARQATDGKENQLSSALAPTCVLAGSDKQGRSFLGVKSSSASERLGMGENMNTEWDGLSIEKMGNGLYRVYDYTAKLSGLYDAEGKYYCGDTRYIRSLSLEQMVNASMGAR